jgi:hypothetical protein
MSICPNTLVRFKHPENVELFTLNGVYLLFRNLMYLNVPLLIFKLVNVNGLKSNTLSPLYVATGLLPN